MERSGGVAAEKSVAGGGRWAPPVREEKGSPVDGVVTSSSALVMVPPANQGVLTRDGMLGEEEWITVYGFSPGDTNLVLREFEKCGVILKHVPGPRDANWMHILYQNRYDAQKALAKNGAQLNSVLIIGVKPVDPSQRQYLNEKVSINSNGGFMGSLPSQSASKRSSTLSSVPLVKDGGGHRSTGAVASPVKSVVSRVMDLMFGL
ncbi:nuclear pore complex protein NUP35-like [Asparagus officinalis]|nr:nuclear pore complex protein NUP35-like [Asparagus officinalis]